MACPGVLEDFRACCELRPPSRMPVFALGLEFNMRMFGLTYAESRTDVDKMTQCQVEAVERYGCDWGVIFPDDYIEFEPLGLKMRDDENHPAMADEYLTMDRGTLGGFRIPDAQKEMRLPIHLEMIRRLKERLGDTAVIMGRIAAPFSTLGLIYGIDALMIGMLESAGLVRDNMAFFVDHQVAFGKAQLEAGADLLWLGDCLADSNFIRPEHFEEFALGPASEVAQPMTDAGGLVIYHTAETSIPHLKLQVQIPASAINVGERVSIAAIKQELAPKKCLTGNFDPMLLRDATPEVVADATEKMIRENLPGGGYVFNTGEGVMHNSKPESIEAMMETARALAAEAGRLF